MHDPVRRRDNHQPSVRAAGWWPRGVRKGANGPWWWARRGTWKGAWNAQAPLNDDSCRFSTRIISLCCVLILGECGRVQTRLALANFECFHVISSTSQLRVLLGSWCKRMPYGNPPLSVSCFGLGVYVPLIGVCVRFFGTFSWVLGSLMGVFVRCFGEPSQTV